NRVVVQCVEEVAGTWLLVGVLGARLLEIQETWQFGGVALAEIGEDEAQILLDRVALDADALAERLWLPRLLGALAVRAEHPAVVAAADRLALHPADRELGTAVGTAEVHQVRCAGLATVEGEVLAHDADRLRLADVKLASEIDREPERAQVAAGQGARTGVIEVAPGLQALRLRF